MRHRKKGRKFKRKRDQRKALLRNLAIHLILNERIQTTKERAKETSRFVEKLITLAKKDNLASYRLVISRLGGNKKAAKKLKEISQRYKERPGGYTRVLKLGKFRKGDGAELALVEFV